MAVEVVAGVLAGSLALLSDAAHMLTDAASIALALVAARFAARPAAGRVHVRLRARGDPFGAGQRRRAVRARRRDRARGRAAPRLATGRGGLDRHRRGRHRRARQRRGVLGAVALRRQSMNVAGARAHVLADLYGSLAAIVAGSSSRRRAGAGRRDRGVDVAALMLRSGWSLLRDSARVLLEAAPQGIDPTRSACARLAARASSRSTTCTSGRSPRASRRWRRTSSWRPKPTATAPARAAGAPARALRQSATRRCRSTTSRGTSSIEIETPRERATQRRHVDVLREPDAARTAEQPCESGMPGWPPRCELTVFPAGEPARARSPTRTPRSCARSPATACRKHGSTRATTRRASCSRSTSRRSAG